MIKKQVPTVQEYIDMINNRRQMQSAEKKRRSISNKNSTSKKQIIDVINILNNKERQILKFLRKILGSNKNYELVCEMIETIKKIAVNQIQMLQKIINNSCTCQRQSLKNKNNQHSKASNQIILPNNNSLGKTKEQYYKIINKHHQNIKNLFGDSSIQTNSQNYLPKQQNTLNNQERKNIFFRGFEDNKYQEVQANQQFVNQPQKQYQVKHQNNPQKKLSSQIKLSSKFNNLI